MTRTIETIVQPNVATTKVAIGSRGSPLAMWQATAVDEALRGAFPGMAVTIRTIRTEGDVDQTSSLLEIGGRGVFASALQAVLLDGAIDMAVHSAKDVPTIEPAGLALAAFPMREDARDAVVSRHGVGLEELPASPTVGTSSRRRAVQVLAIRPDATIVELRGNIDTRLRKSESTAYDAVILAAAGLVRMGWRDRIAEYLNIDAFVPSPGQGALAIETRVDPDPFFARAKTLDCADVSLAVRLEREFLRAMGGGCTTPVGSHAVVAGKAVRFRAMMASDDGARLVRCEEEFHSESAFVDVRELADRMMVELAPAWSGVEFQVMAGAPGPLLGKQVLVTGAREQVGRLEAAFLNEAAVVHPMPTLDIVTGSAPESLAAALDQAASGGFDWLVVTSKQTVPALVEFGPDRLNGKAKIAAVGASTAEALRDAGLTVDLVPTQQTGEGLLAAFDELEMSEASVLCLLGNLASNVVGTGLAARGATVHRIESYASREVNDVPAKVRDAVRAGRVDLVVFSSPSSVRAVTRLLGTDIAALSGACLAAIGPTTQRAMESSDLAVHVVADDPSAEGIVSACRTFFEARSGVGD